MSDHEDDIYGPRLGPWKGAGEPVREDEPAHVAACDYGAGPEHGVVFRRDFWHNGGTGRVLYLCGCERILSADELRQMGVTTSEAFFRLGTAADAARVPILITADYLRQLKREDRRAARKRRRQARRAKAQVGHTCYLGGGHSGAAHRMCGLPCVPSAGEGRPGVTVAELIALLQACHPDAVVALDKYDRADYVRAVGPLEPNDYVFAPDDATVVIS